MKGAYMIKRFALALLASTALSSAHAQTPRVPVFDSVTTAALNNIVYLRPYSAANPTGIHTDCSVDAMGTINSIITSNLTAGNYNIKIVLPPGCLGATQALVVPGTNEGLPSNISYNIDIGGAGQSETTIKALNALTNVFLMDADLAPYPNIHDFTVDGANQATNVMNVAKSGGTYHNLTVQNAAVGGKVLWALGGSNYDNILIWGLNNSGTQYIGPTDYLKMPDYGLYVDSTDKFFSNIGVINAKIAPFYESANGTASKYVNMHAYGYGINTDFVNWTPQYCYVLAAFQSKYSNISCDGAQVAAVQVSNYDIAITNSSFQWQPEPNGNPTVGSAVGIQITGGPGKLWIAGNTFENVSAANAIVPVGSLGSGYSYIGGNPGASYSVGAWYADNYYLNGSFGETITPNGPVVSYYAPTSTVNLVSLNGATTGNGPGVYAAGADSVIPLVLGGKGGGPVTIAGNLNAATIASTNGTISTFYAPASAVNYLTFSSAATGNGPGIFPGGADTNIPLVLGGKGSGGTIVTGNFTGGNVAATSALTGTTLTVSNAASVGSITSANVALPVNTANGRVLDLYAPASAVNHVSLNAEPTGVDTQLTVAGDTNANLNIFAAGTGIVKLGAGTTVGGSPILPLTGTTGSIGGSALSAGQCAQGTVAITGATTSMVAAASPAGGVNPGDAMDAPKAWVSSAGTVTVKVCTQLAAGATPSAATYNVRVIQ